MAQVYLDSMYQGFQTSGHMIEKYNALAPGLAGYGGVSPVCVPQCWPGPHCETLGGCQRSK